MTATTMATRGDDYVSRWPQVISDRAGISVEYVATAMRRLGLIDQTTETDLRQALLTNQVHPAIGGLVGPDAKRVIQEVVDIANEILTRRSTHCHYCGLPLRGDECDECV